MNLGDDADTTAAVYGQLAGGLLRRGGDTGALISKLAHRGVEDLAEKLFDPCPGAG
jgi:ADP-ribosyl-[dinitrogen reductase] hydrolase